MFRRTFTLRDLLALVACAAILFAIFAPMLSRWRERSQRNACMLMLGQIGIGSQNHESAQRRFFLASDAPAPLAQVAPGSVGPEVAAGYSWHIKILPYFCEVTNYKNLGAKSQQFTLPPFSPSLIVPGENMHYATRQITNMRCPTTTPASRIGSATPSEYDALNLPGGRPIATSYVAIAGTHVDASGQVVENGVIVSKCATDPNCRSQGVTSRQVGDGSARTLLVCESREMTYAAWIDGQATWVVGVAQKGAGVVDESIGYPGASQHLIQVGGDPRTGATPYSTLAFGNPRAWPGMSSRQWGPSSAHPGSAVGHVYLDAHVKYLNSSMDPTLYYRLITRNAGDTGWCEDEL